MLPLPDHLHLPTSEFESQQELQGINIQNYNQRGKDDISHPIKPDTACEPSNDEPNEGRPKRTRRPPAYFTKKS